MIMGVLSFLSSAGEAVPLLREEKIMHILSSPSGGRTDRRIITVSANGQVDKG